jgi:hypothetical protein
VKRRYTLAIAAACIAAILAGCSEEPPVLSRVYGRVIYNHDPTTGDSAETLGVFLVANDPDGMEDLSAFYVISDDAELFWKVDSASWISANAEGESWIGSTSISMPGSTPLPAGEYRVLLQSVSGDTVEQTMTVPLRTVSAAEASYPTVTVEGDTITISNAPSGCEIWLYGKSGAFSSIYPVNARIREVSLKSLAASAPQLDAGFTFRLFVWNDQAGYGMLCGPYSSSGLSGP